MVFVSCVNGQIQTRNNCMRSGSGILRMSVRKAADLALPAVLVHKSGRELLSKECANVIGGFTNNQQVLNKNDILKLNTLSLRNGSGFLSVPIQRNSKKKEKRNNIKFTI